MYYIDSILSSFSLDITGLFLLSFCAAFVGFSKSALPGAIFLIVPLSAFVLPAKTAVGVILPLLMFGDVLTTGYFSKQINVNHIKFILPSAFCGVTIGYLLMGRMSSDEMKPIIGGVVLAMLLLKQSMRIWDNRTDDLSDQYEPHSVKNPLISILFGFLMGTIATMAHAAGPLTALYLFMNHFPKKEFIATSAGFFLFINWMKVPFYLKLGILSGDILKLDILLAPFIILGFILGIRVLKYIPQRKFDVLIQVLAILASIKLMI